MIILILLFLITYFTVLNFTFDWNKMVSQKRNIDFIKNTIKENIEYTFWQTNSKLFLIFLQQKIEHIVIVICVDS